jgi:hypothetical protein
MQSSDIIGQYNELINNVFGDFDQNNEKEVSKSVEYNQDYLFSDMMVCYSTIEGINISLFLIIEYNNNL